MLHSMTGFARETVETPLGTLTWEIRAVNHRYLDVQFKLPEDLRPREQHFRQQASAALGRGKIECGLYFRRATDQQSDLQVDTELVAAISARVAEVSALVPTATGVSPIEILRWPGVILDERSDPAPLAEAALMLFDQALDELVATRERDVGCIRRERHCPQRTFRF